jgi:acetyl esterase/lipase
MRSFLLPVLALLSAAAALLTWRPAPPRTELWKVAIAVGEFGHWIAALPLGLALLALLTTDGPTRLVTVTLSASAVILLGRPAFLAHRLARDLPAALERSFGARAPGAPFRVARLFVHAAPARVAPESIVFAQRGEFALVADFYRARNRPAGRAPCLVVVHGGGWDGGDRWQLADWNHRWAERGYAVAAISYRLAPQHTWPAPREDVLAAIAWLKRDAERLGLDAGRLVLIGRSAGGQIAAAVAYGARDPAIVGVVSFYAPQDMPFAWSVAREDDALNSAQLMRQYFGGPPDTPERRTLYDSASAQLMIDAGTPPTLLLHGRPDTLVWYRHSERMAASLRAAGVRHHHLELPWATHGFDYNLDGPGGQLADFAIESFLRAVTGGR